MRLLITGASGFLGRRLVKQAEQVGVSTIGWCSPGTHHYQPGIIPADLMEPQSIRRAWKEARPSAVIHAAAMSRMSECEKNPAGAQQLNVEATNELANLCGADGIRMVFASTDLVFDGRRGNYGEDDSPHPLSTYARTKAEAERCVRAHAGNLVARLSLLLGAGTADQPTFFDQQVAALRGSRPVTLFVNEWRTPLLATAAAESLVALAFHSITGIIHLGGPQRLSRHAMGLALAEVLGADSGLVEGRRQEELAGGELRPRDVSLDSSLWRRLFPNSSWPNFQTALRAALAETV